MNTEGLKRRLAASFLLLLLAACVHQDSGRDKGLQSLPNISAAQVSAAARPHKMALVVGVDSYQDPFWPTLHFASRDAEDLARTLRDPLLGGFDQVTVLARSDNTSLAQLRRALDNLQTQVSSKQDTVLVYISSHGSLIPGPQGFMRVLITQDSRHQELAQSSMSIDELEARMAKIPSTRKALVLASCHSGSGKSLFSPSTRLAMRGLKGALPPLEKVSHASLIFSAAAFGQAAREDDRLQHDVYTYYLIEALALGADANGDGAVTASEAHDYARRHTYQFTKGQQVPTLEAQVVGTDPIILAGQIRRPGLPVVYSYAAGFEGSELRIAGRDKGVFPGNIVVEPGLHKVEIIKAGQVLFSSPLQLSAGERVSASALIDRSQPHWSASLRGGGFALLDSNMSGQVLAPVASLGFALRRRDWPLKYLDPQVDFNFSQADQEVRPALLVIPQRVQLLRLGLAMNLATTRWDTRFYAGPHLSLFYLQRQITLREPFEEQTFASILPGLLAGLAWSYGPFELQMEGQTHFLPMVLNGQLRSMASGSLLVGAAWRF